MGLLFQAVKVQKPFDAAGNYEYNKHVWIFFSVFCAKHGRILIG